MALPPVSSSKPASLLDRITKRMGLARTNRFLVDFSSVKDLFPDLVIGNTEFEDFTFFCETTSIPGRTMNTMDFSSWHRPIKIPNGYTFDDVTMSFHLTNDYFIKDLLDRWLGLIINADTYLLNYEKAYRANIGIYQLDQADKIVYGVQLIGAYPSSVKALEFNNTDMDTTGSVSANFTYKDFKKIDVKNPATIPSAGNPLSTYFNSSPLSRNSLQPLSSNGTFPTVMPSNSGISMAEASQPSILDTLNPQFLSSGIAPPITPPTTPDYSKPIVFQPPL